MATATAQATKWEERRQELEALWVGKEVLTKVFTGGGTDPVNGSKWGAWEIIQTEEYRGFCETIGQLQKEVKETGHPGFTLFLSENCYNDGGTPTHRAFVTKVFLGVVHLPQTSTRSSVEQTAYNSLTKQVESGFTPSHATVLPRVKVKVGCVPDPRNGV